MRRLFLFAAAVALLLGLGAPAPTAAQGNLLPPLRLITSARFEHAALDDGRVVVVAQGYKESRERFYLTVQNFTTGNTTEVVLCDGRPWPRLNDEPEWRPAPPGAVRAIVPTADVLLLFDGPLAALGPTDVGGVSTEHYQIWGDGDIGDPQEVGFTKVDFFVGPENRFLYQLQFESTVPRREGAGTRRLTIVVRFFDHNDPGLRVSPPAGG